jgi:hypothetical protein
VSLKDKAAAIWASAQYLVILAVLLLASIALNFWQLKRAWTAPARAENAALKEAQSISEKLIADGQERERKWLDAGDTVAGQLSQASKDYRRAIAQRPLAAQCAPGQERMDAVNKALGNPEAK